jgi:hypothetical protein
MSRRYRTRLVHSAPQPAVSSVLTGADRKTGQTGKQTRKQDRSNLCAFPVTVYGAADPGEDTGGQATGGTPRPGARTAVAPISASLHLCADTPVGAAGVAANTAPLPCKVSPDWEIRAHLL